jgi:chromosome segregation ATPase
MQFMNRMREEQERKKAEKTEAEDRQWQEMLRPLEVERIKAQTEQARVATKRTQATPIEKEYKADPAALATAAKALGYDTADIKSCEPDFQKQVIEGHRALVLNQTETAAQRKRDEDAEAKLEAAELRRIVDANRRERADKRTAFKSANTQLDALEKRMATLKTQVANYEFAGKADAARSAYDEWNRLKTERDVLEAHISALYPDLAPGAESQEGQPQAATDGVIDTKVIDGQTLYKWESDKQWHPNKPTPTKK